MKKYGAAFSPRIATSCWESLGLLGNQIAELYLWEPNYPSQGELMQAQTLDPMVI